MLQIKVIHHSNTCETVKITFKSGNVMGVNIAETSDDSFGIGWPSSSWRCNLIDSFPQSSPSHCWQFTRNRDDEYLSDSQHLGFYNRRMPQVRRINLHTNNLHQKVKNKKQGESESNHIKRNSGHTWTMDTKITRGAEGSECYHHTVR